jgi:ubiquinone/menaquinone biosynthesis C-methylase UbiE
MSKERQKTGSTSWENVNRWYNKIVGKEGHYYHRHVILPKLLDYLKKSKPKKLLDLACGQGVLARCLSGNIQYTGIDLSPSFIEEAKRHSFDEEYLVGDITKPLPLKDTNFDCVTIILAIQDVKEAKKALLNASKHLVSGGTLIIVMNHPCFRIPQNSHWEVDLKKKRQYRRLDRYLSKLEIPIKVQPSKEKKSPKVHSYHRPLSTYSKWLFEAGFCIENMEEWVSDKRSTGGRAKMENMAREEFPLFLCLMAKKK